MGCRCTSTPTSHCLSTFSFVHFIVKLVKNLAEHVFDFGDVAVVFVFRQLSHGHVAHVVVQAIHRLGDVVQYPATEERRQTNCNVKQHLRIHYGLNELRFSGARLFCRSIAI